MIAKNPIKARSFTLNLHGKLLKIDHPLVMGILNITPDSFYEGSRYPSETAYMKEAELMLQEGATFLDIGGQSTRPGAQQLSPKEEIKRILPVIKNILKAFPEALISVDTYSSEVAQAAVHAGAVIINDISAGEMDKEMIPTVGKLKVPYVAMHMQGTPSTMQDHPHYKNVTLDIFDYFIQKIAECKAAGITDVIIDPGFGFGKSLAHNYQLMKHLCVFQQLEKPLLVGISRKSMIYKLLGTSPAEALPGTTVLNLLALQHGAQILRVHDVKPAIETIQLWEYYKNQH